MTFAQDYNTVPERMVEFREKHPEGSLQPADPAKPFEIVEAGGQTFLAYTAAAFRHPDDQRPGIGCAWEPLPGKTNFTRDSELQNAETSAWGRAIVAALAADAKKGIASAEDVALRQADQEWYQQQEQVVGGLRSSIEGAIAKLDDRQKADLKDWFAQENLPPVRKLNAQQADRVLEHLIDLDVEPPAPDGDGSLPLEHEGETT